MLSKLLLLLGLFSFSFLAKAQNVGIGTNNPIQKLDVNGIVRAGSNSSTQGATILIGNYGSGSLTTFGSHYSDGGPVIGYGIVPKVGTVGYTSSSAIPNLSRTAIHLSRDIEFLSAPSSNIAVDTAITMTSNMIIKNNGFVGIGTAIPTEKLQINGDVRIGLVSPANTGTVPGYGNRLYFSGSGASNAFNSDNSDPLWLARYNLANDQTEFRVNIGDNVHAADKFNIGYTSGSFNSLMVVQANGRVGIGTNNPINTLHIKTPNNPYLVLENSTAQFGLGMPNASDKLYIWSYTASMPLMSMLPNGNIGIGVGSNNPTAKLEVNGSLKITDGTQAAGKILTSNAAGLASWQTNAATVPAGMVNAFAGSTAPSGYLICDGAAINRTTYARLFAVIGTTYGNGNGSTTFNLPDLRGEFVRGLDAGRGVDAGRVNGSFQKGTLIANNEYYADKEVYHITSNAGPPPYNGNGNSAIGKDRINTSSYPSVRMTYTSGSVGTTVAMSPYVNALGAARPRNVAMNYCIKF